ncbi:alpha-glucosidase [Phenylobacterium montanum]|uniref:Alpha-glucosidase n=1 Tax=Phenylobacterium montanum TaxID=2823693 RepID=A0A975IWT7_9CAUL|nr:alpha-glucosidase [Caulobacter sp. S6]QUD88711.1 alpha-glucosidase [Caulobacter sp. S6]
MQLIDQADGFDLALDGRIVARHRAAAPMIFVGQGEPSVQMNKGHFKIDDYVVARVPLAHARIVRRDGEVRLAFSAGPSDASSLTLVVTGGENDAAIRFEGADASINRLWLRIAAEQEERVWGGGEQLSYFDMRGRRFPMWTSEPGNGRDKSTLMTFKADRTGSGGDYYNTNYPQPTWLSSRRYALHVETTAYSAFDFRHGDFHEIEVWAVPERIELWARDHFIDLVRALSDRFGRQPPLPDWVLQGAIVGLKDGERSFERLEAFRAAGAAISGIWCEDWVGLRITTFGRRLYWDWKWDPKRYPGLDRKIPELAGEGVRFLGYVNPYLCVDGELYPHAAAEGYLALRPDADEPYIVDFGEFDCGIVDFTNPKAAAWFEDVVIGRNMLDFGLSGWMADFGEYLPHDVRLASGLDGMLAHNAWPTLWGQVNARAVASRGKTGEALFFMRAGFTGVQAHCPLLWAGDQSVDFTRHDGLPSVICAALSSGLVGNAFHHSDIGGYTSLYGNVRTAELMQRWSEMAAFTPVMRSHEGNRPDQNLQLDQDPDVLAHFARMTRIYRHLAPYLAELSQEAATTGVPVQRPLFLHFEGDPRAFECQVSYLYGPDLLVAPVLEAGAERWSAYLPAGAEWRHLWSGETFAGGAEVSVAAPIGQPPVFYRADAARADLFAALATL